MPKIKRSKAYKEARRKASRTLGDNVYKAKSNYHLSKEKWWKGREAQHLIPFSVGYDYRIPFDLLNSYNNGTMLPSGRLRAKSVAKFIKYKHFKRISHIEPGTGLDHKKYSKTISNFLEWIENGKKVDLVENFNRIAYVIRLATKLKSNEKDSSKRYVNYIELGTLQKLYNSNDAIIQDQYKTVSQSGSDGMLKYKW